MSSKQNKSTGTKTSKPASAASKPGTSKPAKAPKAAIPKPPREKRISALDAAARVIADASKPMSAKELIEQMLAKKLWSSPKGKTPEATLSAAIGREIKALGKDARFTKEDRGLFGAGKGGAK